MGKKIVAALLALCATPVQSAIIEIGFSGIFDRRDTANPGGDPFLGFGPTYQLKLIVDTSTADIVYTSIPDTYGSFDEGTARSTGSGGISGKFMSGGKEVSVAGDRITRTYNNDAAEFGHLDGAYSEIVAVARSDDGRLVFAAFFRTYSPFFESDFLKDFDVTYPGNQFVIFDDTKAAIYSADRVYSSTVPEPATWGMMIVGFGVAGTAMRRRSTKVSFA